MCFLTFLNSKLPKPKTPLDVIVNLHKLSDAKIYSKASFLLLNWQLNFPPRKLTILTPILSVCCKYLRRISALPLASKCERFSELNYLLLAQRPSGSARGTRSECWCTS